MATIDRSPDRERAVRDLASDLAVTAGAGAGKTTVLVGRFVTIARDERLGPERVLAITFTRKAAVEMKERAIREFERAGETALRLRTEAAYISTIHGFSERLLRERPFDARIDPAFRVLTEYDRRLFAQDALDELYGRAELHDFAQRLGKSFGSRGGWRVFALVQDVARLLREGPGAAAREAALVEDEEACVRAALERARAYAAPVERRLFENLRTLLPLLSNASFRSRGAKYAAWQDYVAAVERCLASGRVDGVDTGVWRATAFTSEIPADERGPIRLLLDAVKQDVPIVATDWDLEERLERELVPLKRVIYSAARALEARYAAHKRAQNALDFHDLQRRAHDMLQERPHVRGEYAERFRHILLDESQDTDELQFDLVNALRHDGNTLFMVGDPKQAIYEFRGANPDVFHGALARLPERARLELPENFRSRSEIVSFVNGIGPALLGDQFLRIRGCADYGGLPLDAPAVTALWAIRGEDTTSGATRSGVEPTSRVRAREAAALAEEIARLLVERPLVRDPEQREVEWVPLRPRHVAVLFRTRTAIPYVERAFAARGIPYVTAAGQGFYDRAEVLDGIMMLRVLAQPSDDLALAAVLRSPFFGVSDADLWRLTRAARASSKPTPPPLWRALRRDAELQDVARRIHELRRRVRGLPAWAALEEAIRAFHYEAAIAAHPDDGPAMLANLAKLRRQLRALGAATPHEAVAELERTRELMDAEPLAPLVGSADDVVVLTTIHQAKGLEWPVVCLPNLQAKRKRHDAGFSARHGMLLLDALDADGEARTPLSVRSAQEELDARAEAEERRLLYVALTRARERLILSATVTEGELAPKPGDRFDSPLAFLLRNTQGELAQPGEHDLGSFRTRVRLVTEDPGVVTRYQGGVTLAEELGELPPPAPDEPVAADAPALRALPVSLKVTELLAYERCPQVYRFAHLLEIPEHAPRRARVRGDEAAEVSPVELGTIVHDLLERADFHAADRDAEVARLLREQPPERHARLTRMLAAVLDGEVGAMVRAAHRVEREWPFALRVGGVLLEGVMDLALQGADGRWTVVDYKSNDISRTGRLEYLADYYAPQLELYGLALSRAGLGEVAECVLVFLNGPVVRRWAFPAAATREAWAERLVRAIAEGRYETNAGPKCEGCGYRKRGVCDAGRTWTAARHGLAAPDDVVGGRRSLDGGRVGR